MTLRDTDSLRTGLKDQGRRRRGKQAETAAVPLGRTRNDLCPHLDLVRRSPNEISIPSRNVRTIDEAQLQRVMHSISVSGFVDPPIVDETGSVLDGAIRVIAARKLNLPTIPCIVTRHLNAMEKRALRLALNRLGEKGVWSLPELKTELLELIEAGIEIADTGFSIPEFDEIVLGDGVDAVEEGRIAPVPGAVAVSKPGDVFIIDDIHRIICGDATDPTTYFSLMQGNSAALIPTDVPYNVKIGGHVTKGDHREFPMASGEMTDEQFLAFNQSWMQAALPHLRDGGMLGTYIDWRGYPTVHRAALGATLTAINLIVWAKTNAGLGSLYRSQHELFALYKKGTAAHINNIQLGKAGRWRSNLWTYPGASSVGSDSRKGLQLHPTVKPAAMCADYILDLTNRGDILLDPFLGSGSNLIAAQRTGRRCFAIELDPLYVDVAIRRYEEVFGGQAVLDATGETFATVARQRQ